MKYLGLVLSGLRRNLTRTLLTTLSIAIAYLLFGLLDPISQVFETGPNVAGGDRLIVAPKHSISDMLPVGHIERIRQLPGVEVVAHQTWFGGTFKDPENSFTQWAVSPREYMLVFEEALLAPDQLEAFLASRTAAIAGREIADKYNMKIGDKLPFIPNIWHNRDGTHWEFDLVGIYDGADETVDTRRFLFRYDFFDEYRAFGNGTMSNALIKVTDQADPNQVASQVDELFANSRNETLTSTEREYILSFARQLGDIGLIVDAILFAVFFTILLLTANTMAQGVRDRIPELAILKTLGFQDITILWLILSESILIFIIGASIGLTAAGFGLIAIGDFAAANQFGVISMTSETIVTGFVICIIVGVLVGLPPALQAKQLNIINALRST